MITVDQFHEYRSDLLEDEYYDIVPNICTFCKHPLIVNTELTIMKCSNKSCPRHLSYRADNMFEDMGIKYIGAETALRMIVENKLKNHMEILGLTVDQMPSNSSPEVKQQRYNELQKGRRQSLSKILKMYQLNGLSEQTANKLMGDYNSFSEFFSENDDIMKLSRTMVRTLKRKEITYNLLRMSYHLISAKDELIEVEKYFDIVKLSDEKIRLCITGGISSVYMAEEKFKPRERFIDVLNEKYLGIVSFVNTGNNVTDAKYLLTDSTRSTPKFISAKDNGVMILSFATFCDFLEYHYGKGNESIEIKRRNKNV